MNKMKIIFSQSCILVHLFKKKEKELLEPKKKRNTVVQILFLFMFLFSNFSSLFEVFLHQQQSINTPIILRIIRHLRKLPPHHLPRLCHQPQLTNIHLKNGPLGNHTKRSVKRRLRVLFHSQNIEIEGRFELGVGDMGFFVSHPGGANESLVLGGFSCEFFSNKSCLGDHSLPLLLSSFPCFENFEHLVFADRPDLREGDIPLSSLLLPLLLDHVAQNLRTVDLLTIEQVGRHSPLSGGLLSLLLGGLLFVHFDGLLHLNLLGVSLLVVDLSLQTLQKTSFFGFLVRQTGLLLSLLLKVIIAITMTLSMKLNMFVLGHGKSRGGKK